ncbi:MAG TPA: hypothetical protein VES89_08295 [Candidatus Competibacteraceae bacterium]|nr:hypothetical protein [Candidatus Competibacteraceae bacterium]
MALLEDLVESPNLWIGIGVALAAPVVLPVIGAVVRPLTKAAIKGYLATAEALTPVVAGVAGQVRERLAEPIEQFQDLIEAAKQERAMATAPTIQPGRAEGIQISTSAVTGTEAEPTPAEVAPTAARETPALVVPGTVEAAPVPRRPRKRRSP